MTCAQGLLRLLWGGARSWSVTGLQPTTNNPFDKKLELRKLDHCISVQDNKLYSFFMVTLRQINDVR